MRCIRLWRQSIESIIIRQSGAKGNVFGDALRDAQSVEIPVDGEE